MPAPPEALLVCPLCRQDVAVSAYEDHLRREHDLIEVVRQALEAPLPGHVKTA